MKRIILIAFAALHLLNAQTPPTSLPLQTPAPAAVQASANVVGNNGTARYSYWVVAHYPGGTVVSSPAQIQLAPSTLTGSNYVSIGWQQPAGAYSYDVIRLTPPANFNGSCVACAVATGTVYNTVADNGGTLANYTVAANAVSASGTLYINTRDYTPPQLRQVINGVDLPVVSFQGLPAGTPSVAPSLHNASPTLLSNNMDDGTNYGSALAISPVDGSLFATYSDLSGQWLWHAANELWPVGTAARTFLTNQADKDHQTSAIFFPTGTSACPTIANSDESTKFYLTIMTGAGCTAISTQTQVTIPTPDSNSIYQFDASPGTDGFTQVVYVDHSLTCAVSGDCRMRTLKCSASPCGAPTPNTGLLFKAAPLTPVAYSVSMTVNSANHAVYAFVPFGQNNVVVGVNNDATGTTITSFTLSVASSGFGGSRGINNLKVLETTDNRIIIGFGNQLGAAMAVCSTDAPAQASDCPITQLTTTQESVNGGALLNGVIGTVTPATCGSSYGVLDEVLPTQTGANGGILMITSVDDMGCVLALQPEPGIKTAQGAYTSNGTNVIVGLTGTLPAVGNLIISASVPAGTVVTAVEPVTLAVTLSAPAAISGNIGIAFFDQRGVIGARYSVAANLPTTTITPGEGDGTLTVNITAVNNNIPVFSALSALNLASPLYLITGCGVESCTSPAITQVNNYQSDNLPAPVATDSSGNSYIAGVGFGKSNHVLFHAYYADGSFRFYPGGSENQTGGQYQIVPWIHPVALRMDQTSTYNSLLFAIANTGNQIVTPVYGGAFGNSIPPFTSLAPGAITPTMQWDNILGNQNGFSPQPAPSVSPLPNDLSFSNLYGSGCPFYAAWNFAIDGGAVGTITPALNVTVPVNFVVTGAILNSTTALTSGGAATIAIGLSAGASGTAALVNPTAVASWSTNALIAAKPSFTSPVKLSAPGVVTITVGTADLTGGYLGVCLFGFVMPI